MTIVSEVNLISGVKSFDLIVPRLSHLQFLRTGDSQDPIHRVSQIIADNTLFAPIRNRILNEVAELGINVPAFATYFPDITSENEEDRQLAVRAIANTVDLAIEVSSLESSNCQPNQPIVEIVCGTIIDQDSKGSIDDRRIVYDQEHKLDVLIRSLVDVIQLVGESKRFAIALELEPGDTYVMNSVQAIQGIISRVKQFADQPGQKNTLLSHVGLNIDVAHMRIARISAEALTTFADFIVHAHISDHPGMHMECSPKADPGVMKV